MKIECNKTILLKALNKAERVVSKNPSLPVLSCLIIETDKDQIFIKATNLEIGLKIKVPAKIFNSGSVAIPSGIFTSYLSNLGSEEHLLIEKIENILLVSGNKSETKINTLSPEDFPSIPDTVSTKTTKISSKELLEGLKSVWYASSITSMKPELSSVYIYPAGNELYFVATDSFRLAEKKIQIKTDTFESVLIPQKNVTEIIKIFDDLDEKISINFEDEKVSFESDSGIYLISRVIDGNFPDYKQIIPKESKTEVTVLKNDIQNSLKIANLFSDNFNQIKFMINVEDNIFEMISKNSEKGETRNSVSGSIKGESLEINFNQRYINESFASIESESLTMFFNGNGKPMVIKSSRDSSFQYLVMPLNK
jgi:DNA polymerase III subunit beta